jgi:hypothetical protein
MEAVQEAAPLLNKLVESDSTSSSSSSSLRQNGTTSSLTKITPTIYFLAGDEAKQSPSSPSAILIFAWMGAPLRHMSKFIEYYSQSYFPGSPIILVLSPTNEFMSRKYIRQKALQPAASLFQSLNIPQNRLLVHIFSNGGINALRTFISVLPEGKLEPKVLVIDSAPGTSSMTSAVKAFTAHIKNRLWKYLMRFVVGIMYLFLVLRETIMRRQPFIEEMRAWLTHGNAIGKKTKLVYLYSDKDELVGRRSVESNIRDMKDRGYEVKSRNFGETPHVGHMRANPEVYWSEILGVWRE